MAHLIPEHQNYKKPTNGAPNLLALDQAGAGGFCLLAPSGGWGIKPVQGSPLTLPLTFLLASEAPQAQLDY